MRILLPSIVDPWTHAGGAAAVTRGLLVVLQQAPLAAEVDVVTPQSPLPHALRRVVALARAALAAEPSKALFLATAHFRKAMARMIATRAYDLVLINGSDLLGLVLGFVGTLPQALPTVLYAHNLEHDLFASQLADLPKGLGWMRRALRRDVAKLARYELAGMRAAGHALFVSADDQARVAATIPGLRSLHVPPLFAYEPRPRGPRASGALRLGFLANFRWWPNRRGLRWLLREVLSRVERDFELHLFGEGSDRFAGADRRIVAHGFLGDVTAAFAASDVMLCPIVAGAGVNVKFAEALYNGVPVFGTRFSARGLPATASASVVLADGADEWVRMLDGGGIDRLAAERVPSEVARVFAPGPHARAVHAFLREAAGLSAQRPAC